MPPPLHLGRWIPPPVREHRPRQSRGGNIRSADSHVGRCMRTEPRIESCRSLQPALSRHKSLPHTSFQMRAHDDREFEDCLCAASCVFFRRDCQWLPAHRNHRVERLIQCLIKGVVFSRPTICRGEQLRNLWALRKIMCLSV